MDKLRAQIHTLTLQLEDERSRHVTAVSISARLRMRRHFCNKCSWRVIQLFVKKIIEQEILNLLLRMKSRRNVIVIFIYYPCFKTILLVPFYITLQSEFQRSSTTNQQTTLRRKKKKNKRLDTTTSGIFVRRGVSSPRTIHCLEKDI